MPRPRKHDDHTRREMITAAERLMDETGPEGLSVRGIADATETTTWAVYSLFGSREGLLAAVALEAIAALDDVLTGGLGTDDPAADLVHLGAIRYRAFVSARPWPFRLAFQRVLPDLVLGAEFFEARAAVWKRLERRFERLQDAGLLGPRTITQAAVQFNALCEGLANAELRGGTMASEDEAMVWRGAFEALVGGFAAPARAKRRTTAKRGR